MRNNQTKKWNSCRKKFVGHFFFKVVEDQKKLMCMVVKLDEKYCVGSKIDFVGRFFKNFTDQKKFNL